jgi:hypothetical protein
MGFLLYSRPVLAAVRFWFYGQQLRQVFLRRLAGFDRGSCRDFYREVWWSAASRLGAEIRELPGGFLEVRHGQRVTRMKEWLVMLDDPVTLSLAGNKAVVNEMLRSEGLPVPPNLTYTLGQINHAWDFLRSQGAPCVVKPVSETGGGHGVTTGVETRWQLVKASAHAANWTVC